MIEKYSTAMCQPMGPLCLCQCLLHRQLSLDLKLSVLSLVRMWTRRLPSWSLRLNWIKFWPSVIFYAGCGEGSLGNCDLSIWRGDHVVGYVPGGTDEKFQWEKRCFLKSGFHSRQLREGVKKLAEGGEEGAQEIRLYLDFLKSHWLKRRPRNQDFLRDMLKSPSIES